MTSPLTQRGKLHLGALALNLSASELLTNHRFSPSTFRNLIFRPRNFTVSLALNPLLKRRSIQP